MIDHATGLRLDQYLGEKVRLQGMKRLKRYYNGLLATVVELMPKETGRVKVSFEYEGKKKTIEAEYGNCEFDPQLAEGEEGQGVKTGEKEMEKDCEAASGERETKIENELKI